MGKNRMIAKSCPKCDMQVAVASKSCKCGHTFFANRRGADQLPAVEDIKRRTGRVRRAQPQFYDSLDYEKQKKRIPKKRSLSEDNLKSKDNKSESATARARRRRALRRALRPAPPPAERRDSPPALLPAQLDRCGLILQEINRKMGSVVWKQGDDQ